MQLQCVCLCVKRLVMHSRLGFSSLLLLFWDLSAQTFFWVWGWFGGWCNVQKLPKRKSFHLLLKRTSMHRHTPYSIAEWKPTSCLYVLCRAVGGKGEAGEKTRGGEKRLGWTKESSGCWWLGNFGEKVMRVSHTLSDLVGVWNKGVYWCVREGENKRLRQSREKKDWLVLVAMEA